IRQSMLFEELAIEILDGEIQSPKITAILVRRSLFGLIHDAQLNPMGVRCFNAREIKKSECDRLEHSLFTTHPVVALLNTGTEIQLIPLRLVLLAPVVPRFEVMSFVKINLPHVLAHGVTPRSTARAETNMVIDLAVGHQGARIFVLAGERIHEVPRFSP